MLDFSWEGIIFPFQFNIETRFQTLRSKLYIYFFYFYILYFNKQILITLIPGLFRFCLVAILMKLLTKVYFIGHVYMYKTISFYNSVEIICTRV